MKLRTIILAALGVLVGIFYMIFAYSLQGTTYVWALTRGFGLLAYASLIVVVLSGELWMLGIKRIRVLHCPAGALTAYFAFLHGLSALFDRFRYGPSIRIIDYLGFSFSDKWLVLLSLGTLSFYLIALVSITSSAGMIKRLGYQRWKLVHYFSYVALTIIFIHSILLGTDLKVTPIRNVFFPSSVFLFALVSFLIIVRVARNSLEGVRDKALILFVVVLAAGSAAVFADGLRLYHEQSQSVGKDRAMLLDDLDMYSERTAYYWNLLGDIETSISQSQTNSRALMSQIDRVVADTGSSVKGINNSVTYVTQVINNTPQIVYVPEIRYVYVNQGESDD
jgi:methionine sulfoxide reductase heme-binding subunit